MCHLSTPIQVQATCQSCPKGTSQPDIGQTTCEKCTEGKFNDAVGSSSCENCPVNTNSPGTSTDKLNCTCNPGFTGATWADCSACMSGKYKEVSGTAACTDCAAGKYSTQQAMTADSACSGCPANSYSPQGSNEGTDCTCVEGFIGPAGGPCEPCGSSTWLNSQGVQTCCSKTCSASSYRSAECSANADIVCTTCPQNSFVSSGANVGKSSCKCNAGYFNSNGVCSVCAP